MKKVMGIICGIIYVPMGVAMAVLLALFYLIGVVWVVIEGVGNKIKPKKEKELN